VDTDVRLRQQHDCREAMRRKLVNLLCQERRPALPNADKEYSPQRLDEAQQTWIVQPEVSQELAMKQGSIGFLCHTAMLPARWLRCRNGSRTMVSDHAA
jgi:hypothetical protein